MLLLFDLRNYKKLSMIWKFSTGLSSDRIRTKFWKSNLLKKKIKILASILVLAIIPLETLISNLKNIKVMFEDRIKFLNGLNT